MAVTTHRLVEQTRVMPAYSDTIAGDWTVEIPRIAPRRHPLSVTQRQRWWRRFWQDVRWILAGVAIKTVLYTSVVVILLLLGGRLSFDDNARPYLNQSEDGQSGYWSYSCS